VLQFVAMCVAVCCSLLQCVAVCCSVLQQKTKSSRDRETDVLQCVAVCAAVCRSVLQCVAAPKKKGGATERQMCCRVLQCVLQCALQCVAVCCSKKKREGEIERQMSCMKFGVVCKLLCDVTCMALYAV